MYNIVTSVICFSQLLYGLYVYNFCLNCGYDENSLYYKYLLVVNTIIILFYALVMMISSCNIKYYGKILEKSINVISLIIIFLTFLIYTNWNTVWNCNKNIVVYLMISNILFSLRIFFMYSIYSLDDTNIQPTNEYYMLLEGNNNNNI